MILIHLDSLNLKQHVDKLTHSAGLFIVPFYKGSF